MRLPTFIIGGGARCGTTYLYELCNHHPEIYVAQPRQPEPKFFSVDEEYEKGIEYYAEKYFSGAGDALAVGEKSVSYLDKSNVVASRILTRLRYMKFVFILRNPIFRSFSHYLYSYKEGLETSSFENALGREINGIQYPPELHGPRPFSYMERGLYAKLLRPYFDYFWRGSIKIILLDDVCKNPEMVALRLFTFLEVSPEIPKSFDISKKIHSAWEGEEMSQSAYNFLRGVFYYPNQKLSELIGRDLGEWNAKL